MAAMSTRIHELATGVASCVLLLPSGCRRPPAELSVDPESGVEPVADSPASDCDCEAAKAAARPAPGSAGETDPPVVIGGRFVARDRVQLTFSEALAPPEQVNPRQFRLSMAYSSIDYGAEYASGYYYDLGGGDNYYPPVVVIELEPYADRPEVLALQLSRPVPTELCQDIADMRDSGDVADPEGPVSNERIGLFLHYTTRGSVGIRDLAGNPLGDMGGEWALHFGSRHKTSYGTDPVMRLDLLVELACPDETLGISAPPGPS